MVSASAEFIRQQSIITKHLSRLPARHRSRSGEAGGESRSHSKRFLIRSAFSLGLICRINLTGVRTIRPTGLIPSRSQ